MAKKEKVTCPECSGARIVKKAGGKINLVRFRDVSAKAAGEVSVSKN